MKHFVDRNLDSFHSDHLIKLDGSYAENIHDYIDRESSVAKNMFKKNKVNNLKLNK